MCQTNRQKKIMIDELFIYKKRKNLAHKILIIIN